jgi:pyruvate dehydrogenase E1 component
LGRSDTRKQLRRHFEVDAETITVAALHQLARLGKCDNQCVARALGELGIDPEKRSPLFA